MKYACKICSYWQNGVGGNGCLQGLCKSECIRATKIMKLINHQIAIHSNYISTTRDGNLTSWDLAKSISHLMKEEFYNLGVHSQEKKRELKITEYDDYGGELSTIEIR